MNMARDYSEEEREPTDTADEDMLEKVRMGMGNEGGPPPGSGMKWEDLAEDQAALEGDPSPENVQAFVQYWGAENLPQGLQQGGAAPQPAEGNPVQDTILRMMQGRVDRSR
jgi:hypothetical protein